MKLYVHEHTRKADGEKFISYSTKGKDGKWYNVRFTKDVKNQISCEGNGIIDQIDVSKNDIFIPQNNDFPTVIITRYKNIIFREHEVLPF